MSSGVDLSRVQQMRMMQQQAAIDMWRNLSADIFARCMATYARESISSNIVEAVAINSIKAGEIYLNCFSTRLQELARDSESKG